MAELPAPVTVACEAPTDAGPCPGRIVTRYFTARMGGVYESTEPCPLCAGRRRAQVDVGQLITAALRYCDPDVAQRHRRKLREDLVIRDDARASNKAAWALLCEMPERRSTVVLGGPPGAGKTFLALHTVKRLCEQGTACAVLTEADLVDLVRLTGYQNPRQWDAREAMATLTRVPLLALDDVGQLRERTDRDRDQIETLLYRRSEAGRALIVTTNCTDDELVAWAGDRLASRLYAKAGRGQEVHGRWR